MNIKYKYCISFGYIDLNMLFFDTFGFALINFNIINNIVDIEYLYLDF